MLIRTGNTNRLSNFLLFQAAYAEIFFEEKLWPDFTRDDFKKYLDAFKKTDRRFGKRIED
jgi:undecaprenyl diphosphate synthase